MKKLFAATLTLSALAITAAPTLFAQEPEGNPVNPGRIERGERQGVAGTISEIKGDTLTIKTFQGPTATVKTNSNTTYRVDREQAKFSDLKVGDFVFVRGEQSGKDQAGNPQWTAQIVGKRSGGGPGGPGGQRGMMFNREDMGKKFIAGEVTKIDGTKLTVKRPDNVEQTIEVDDDTSFVNAKRENITFTDIKVGDFVGGQGELKSGTFVPKTLRVGPPPRMMRAPGTGEGHGSEQPAPPPNSSTTPAPGAPGSATTTNKPQDQK